MILDPYGSISSAIFSICFHAELNINIIKVPYCWAASIFYVFLVVIIFMILIAVFICLFVCLKLY